MGENIRFAMLEDRGILAVGGGDRIGFLQGLVSNDMEKVGPSRALYAALLTAQGKYLFDFFVVAIEGAFLLDCERSRLEELAKRLAVYKLRADVTLDDLTDDFAVAALFGDGAAAALGLEGGPGSAVPFADGAAYVDPRLAAAGVRAVLPGANALKEIEAAGFAPAEAADYDRLRLGLGLPDGSRDLVAEKSILLESGFEELNGIDWDKGCFMGQELTARTKYRGLVKKRLVPVTLDGPPPEPGTPVMLADAEAGELRSGLATGEGGIALALMRLESMAEAARTGAGFSAAGIGVKPAKPDWAVF
ncbi:MAG: folate-binding protein YgfZ [Proteobacteria bacterium]|nr:folate-binding protein YgfZ [Pseudomonadota bacterium]